MTELEDHQANLSRFCRVCGQRFASDKLTNVTENFLSVFKLAYDVDVSRENKYVFPSKFCSSCRQKLNRYSNKVDPMAKHLPVLSEFIPHSEQCEICRPVPRGQRKRVKTTHAPNTSGITACKSSKTPHEIAKQLAFTDHPTPTMTVLNSIPLKQFPVQIREVALIYKCSLCDNVPVSPSQPSGFCDCGHIFCRECLTEWLQLQAICPKCYIPISTEDIMPLKGHLASIHGQLKAHCLYEAHGCDVIMPLQQIIQHTVNCIQKNKPVLQPKSFHKKKTPLINVDRVYARNVRLKDIVAALDDLCLQHFEEKEDVLFFLLKEHLRNRSDPREEEIAKLWKGLSTNKLTTEECHAMRVSKLQSKGQYKSNYDYLKERGKTFLQPPGKVTKCEENFLPGNVKYSLESLAEGEDYHHTPIKSLRFRQSRAPTELSMEPIDVLSDFDERQPERPTPSIRAVRWSYPDAIAKTLEELNPDIEKGMTANGMDPTDPDVLFRVTIKDGADGLGSVSQYKEKADKYLPDSAFRFTFALVKVEAMTDEYGVKEVYVCDNPNSVQVNRPLLEAIADENSWAASQILMGPIEEERQMLKKSFMKVWVGQGVTRRFELVFHFSMIDEKLDRAESGLQGSGSNYLCTLCYVSSSQEAKEKLGTFSISRRYEDTLKTSRYMADNPDKLSAAQLKALSKGINSVPLIRADAREKGIDATHTDINLASFFYKLIVREIAGVQSWNATERLKPMIDDAAARFDRHIRRSLGMSPSLMMPGNYARKLFHEDNMECVLPLIPIAERKELLVDVFTRFRFIRKIYRSINPYKDYPEDITQLKETAVGLGVILKEHFVYAHWPNYLHKVIEHAQELIEDPNGPHNIGGMSGEGNEAGNRIFRHVRENLAFRGSTMSAL